MKISENLIINDLALIINKDLLLIADPHMGYEESANKAGILLPRQQYQETVKRLSKHLKNKFYKQIIINGDIKHEFGTISDQEWRHTLQLLDLFAKHAKEVILIKGNHDTVLEPIAKKRKVKVLDHLFINDILIIHGHRLNKEVEELFKKSKTIIIGHEHPAITLEEDAKKETYKAFLIGKYKRKQLIVQPSYNLVTEGTNVLKDKLLSPFLKQDLGNFQCIIIGDKEYDFGKLSRLDS